MGASRLTQGFAGRSREEDNYIYGGFLESNLSAMYTGWLPVGLNGFLLDFA
jgi:hypothetical protein